MKKISLPLLLSSLLLFGALLNSTYAWQGQVENFTPVGIPTEEVYALTVDRPFEPVMYNEYLHSTQPGESNDPKLALWARLWESKASVSLYEKAQYLTADRLTAASEQLPQETSPLPRFPLVDDAILDNYPQSQWSDKKFETLSCWSRSCACGRRLRHQVCCDHKNFYRWRPARDMLLVLAGSSVLANSSMDQDIADWYQDEVRSSDTDRFSSFCKTFGEGHYFLPSFCALWALSSMFEDRPLCAGVHGYASRVTRSYLVGVVPLLFMQFALGGSRPGETSHESRWVPFSDTNSLSGHAFIGAVPFITAAQMTENRYAKGCLYFCSALPAWSRVNDNDHYFSQACFGWWMAYMACRAIDETDQPERHYDWFPVADGDTLGIQFAYNW